MTSDARGPNPTDPRSPHAEPADGTARQEKDPRAPSADQAGIETDAGDRAEEGAIPDLLWRLGQGLEEPAALSLDSAGPDGSGGEGRDGEDGGEGKGGWPDDATLRAYREGSLDASDRNAVERALLHDAALRARLAALAGLAPADPSAALRARVLEAHAEAFAVRSTPDESSAGRAEARRGRILSWRPYRNHAGRPSVGTLAAVAAALVLAVIALPEMLGPVMQGLFGPDPLPPGLEWRIETEGLREVRTGTTPEGEPVAPTRLLLRPDTRLRLEASPERAVEDVELGLYRLDPLPPDDGVRGGGNQAVGEIVRLPIDRASLRAERGAVRLEVRAGDLLGEAPAEGELIVVLARQGHLPSPAEVVRALAGPDSPPLFRLYRHPFSLVDPTPSPPPG